MRMCARAEDARRHVLDGRGVAHHTLAQRVPEVERHLFTRQNITARRVNKCVKYVFVSHAHFCTRNVENTSKRAGMLRIPGAARPPRPR